MSENPSSSNDRFAALLQLEQAIRRSETIEALAVRLVNETGRLVPSEQTVLFLPSGGKRLKVQAMANLPAVDRSAPMVQWLEQLAMTIGQRPEGNRLSFFRPDDVEEYLRQDWAAYCPEHIAWVPLPSIYGPSGSLLLAGSHSWSGQHKVLLEHLAEVYGHALSFFRRPLGVLAWKRYPLRLSLAVISALFVFSILLKVPLTATAPAEIVPINPHTVAAPVSGVVKEVMVQPNQRVKSGELVVVLDDTELRNQTAVARMALKVAEEELERARRSAFGDAESKALIAELQAQVKRKDSELQFANDRLEKTRLISRADGVVIGAPKDEWEGKPVVTGTSIIQVADPLQVQVRVFLPVNDAITLEQGSVIRIFLDSAPLHPLTATLAWAGYSPEMSPLGFYAYRIHASLQNEGRQIPRIGLRGSASIQGPRVSLLYALLRKPITFFRQTTGL